MMRLRASRFFATCWLVALAVCLPGVSACATTQGRFSSAAAPASATTRFAVIGDYGLAGPEEKQVADMVHTWNPHYVLTLGDNNYPNGEAESIDRNIGQYYHPYIRFDEKYKGPYSHSDTQKPSRFFPVLGNHDWRSPDARPYLDYFDLPGNERYYRVRLGEVELFALDSDPHEPDGIDVRSVQAQWLQGALENSDAVWKVVTMHHPPYSSGDHGDTAAMQWPFKAWGADLVMAGHDHHYERILADNLPYIVVGSSGAELRSTVRVVRPYATVDFTYTQKHGALLMEATDKTLLLRFYSTDNEIIDEYHLSKSVL